MNYRHAYHAGNAADVLKHVMLARILAYLRNKPAPVRVIDTHAGIGWYDLAGAEAERTGEWRAGIGRLTEPFPPEVEALLAPFREAVSRARARHGPRAYPGSPAIVAGLLRSGDRALFNELHPGDRAVLAGRFGRAPGVKVTGLDGWTALKAFIPPNERRGLVLIDPPYEEPGEHARLAAELALAVRKWPSGVYLAWYPIKDRRAVDAALAGLEDAIERPALRLELTTAPADGIRLAGSGLLAVNPPWPLAEEARILLPALAERLGGADGGFRCEAMAREECAPR